MTVAHDGFVSRHLNRRCSRPIAGLLAYTPVTPNQVSLLSLFIALGSLALFLNDHPLWAGAAVHASSIVDGVDGDLARRKRMATRFGGFLDALLDRYSDVAILGGLTYWSITFEGRLSSESTVIIGVLAIVGALMISYSRARAEASLGFTFRGVAGNPGIQGCAPVDCGDRGRLRAGAGMSGTHRSPVKRRGPLAAGCGPEPFLRNMYSRKTRHSTSVDPLDDR